VKGTATEAVSVTLACPMAHMCNHGGGVKSACRLPDTYLIATSTTTSRLPHRHALPPKTCHRSGLSNPGMSRNNICVRVGINKRDGMDTQKQAGYGYSWGRDGYTKRVWTLGMEPMDGVGDGRDGYTKAAPGGSGPSTALEPPVTRRPLAAGEPRSAAARRAGTARPQEPQPLAPGWHAACAQDRAAACIKIFDNQGRSLLMAPVSGLYMGPPHIRYLLFPAMQQPLPKTLT
jgi:hypothetical protein